MNPCPVYDEFTGTLFLFFIAVLGHTSEAYQLVTGKNVTRLCFISSTDDGDTWGPVTDLTQRVIGETIKGQNTNPSSKHISTIFVKKSKEIITGRKSYESFYCSKGEDKCPLMSAPPLFLQNGPPLLSAQATVSS